MWFIWNRLNNRCFSERKAHSKPLLCHPGGFFMVVTSLPKAVIKYGFSCFDMFFKATFHLGKSFEFHFQEFSFL